MAARRTPLLTALALAFGRPGWGLLLDGASLVQLSSKGPGDFDIQEMGAPLDIMPAVQEHVGVEGTPLKKASVSGAGALVTHDAEAGGPWLKTRKGESFHVMRSGVFNLLDIPKNADKAKQQFHMLGRISPLKQSEPCSSFAMLTGLHMNGTWLGLFRSLTFTAATAKFDTPDSIGIRVNNGYNISVAVLEEYVVAEGYPLKKVTRMHPAYPAAKGQADTLVLEFEFQTMTVTVGWVHSRKFKANWLWVNVSSLEGVPGPVGGILGEDSHKEVEETNSNCTRSHRKKSLVFSSDLPTSPTVIDEH